MASVAPIPVTATPEALRESPLLSACSLIDIDMVIARSTEERWDADAVLFDRGDVAPAVWVMLEGEMTLSKILEGQEIIVDRLGPGAFFGEISLLTGMPAGLKGRAVTPVRLLRIPDPTFRDLLKSCASITETVLRSFAEKVRKFTLLMQQHERMASLGTIAAGVAHELNNPTAAANRAAAQAKESLIGIAPLLADVAHAYWSPATQRLIAALRASMGTEAAPPADVLERSDREDQVCDWLDAHGVAEGWDLSPQLVGIGMTAARLTTLAGDDVPANELVIVLRLVARLATTKQLLDEVQQSTARISELSKAVKAYSHADKMTPRVDDVHAALNTTLTIFGHKLREAKVTVERTYDKSLPPVATFGGELHQVWTNLIDNAIDAMTPGGGTLRVRTTRDGASAVVEIGDSGAGIPPEAVARIFEPFFTTKAVGHGTGLGLEIVQRIVAHHKGSISVTSQPGDTRFMVRLPLAIGD